MKSTSFTHLRKTTLALAILAAGTVFVTQANAASAPVGNPKSPAYGHSYRHGVIPTIQVSKAMKQWDLAHPHPLVANSPTLSFGGGTNGIGVLSGQSKVYLVIYGSQWGTQSTDANGNLKFSGDPSGVAGAAQQAFKGIGTNGELWSAELTQWCDGPTVASGATSCPATGAQYIPYQQNVYAGIWYDNSAASPAAATAAQMANESIAAAAHFGNTTAASNRYTYYVIMSPQGTNPDTYQGRYCAWHDYTADAGVSSPYGELAFSNQPYNVDSGAGCGVGFVNSPGTLDGYTMTLGHEWHEMMSDQDPSGGWQNHNTGTYAGQENSDECAWIAAGSTGGAANITFSTGTFAEQASWSNDTNSCAISHAIVNHGGGGGGTPTANWSDTISGLAVNFTDTSTDAGGSISTHAWTFGDGSTSASANPSHTYAAAGTYSVSETVTDSAGTHKTSTKTANVTVGGVGPVQVLANTGFESTASWAQSAGVICSTGCSGESAHGGVGFSWLNGYGSSHTDTLSQTVAIPAGHASATLSYYLHIDTAETTTTTAYDKLTVALYSGSTLLKTLGTYSNLNKNTGYTVHTNDVSAYIGQTVTVKFTGTEDTSLQTSFVLDDVTLTAN